ncbi:MAG: tRNA (N(6)-L-threonylcarbamoyladenosine(37)-C(2))-methylthiotransferase [Candidatus Altiarchaeota archaeon]|nr:tRNA (N(6)-L-threonylcarbamoyladenosine(37)-C(2))-methylthiotransferase [Candidatus Altiarchaeota archaeon]
MKVYAEWHGCPFSQAETEIAVAQLGKKTNLELADTIILFGCTVKQETEKRMFKRITELKKTGKKLIVIGCLVDVAADQIRELAPKAYLVETGWIDQIQNVFDKKELIGKRQIIKLCDREYGPWPIGIVPIAEGCLGNCSFCQVKLVRGNLFSYPAESIMADVKKAVEKNYREIWLTTQDTAIYGTEQGKELVGLLEQIAELKGEFVVRVGMGNPAFFLKQWNKLKPLLASDRFFEFLHAPVQSGSDSVLQAMRRRHAVDDYVRLAKKFRAAFPTGSLWTDIIVGYPTETEQDFQKTLVMLENTQPNKVNISRYGQRAGTDAAELADIPSWVKKERSRAAVSLSNKLGLELNKKMLGQETRVFMDEQGSGRTIGYRPVAVKAELGNWTNAKISAVRAGYLIAKPF